MKSPKFATVLNISVCQTATRIKGSGKKFGAHKNHSLYRRLESFKGAATREKKKTRSTDSIILAEVVPAETGEVGSVGISG